MTAATYRVELSAIGADLLAARIGRKSRRASALERADSSNLNAQWDDLARAPDWLRLPSEQLEIIARRIALLAMAQSLASSIDGAWLGGLAKHAGEDEVERAIVAADAVPEALTPPVEADELDRLGYSLLAASLPSQLRGYLPMSVSPSDEPIKVIEALLERAIEP